MELIWPALDSKNSRKFDADLMNRQSLTEHQIDSCDEEPEQHASDRILPLPSDNQQNPQATQNQNLCIQSMDIILQTMQGRWCMTQSLLTGGLRRRMHYFFVYD